MQPAKIYKKELIPVFISEIETKEKKKCHGNQYRLKNFTNKQFNNAIVLIMQQKTEQMLPI